MKNEEKIREEIRAVLNKILDEEYERALQLLEQDSPWLVSGKLGKEDEGPNDLEKGM